MLIQDKNNVFLKNTANKHRAINIMLTELEKPGCKAFHLYDDALILQSQVFKVLEMSNR